MKTILYFSVFFYLYHVIYAENIQLVHVFFRHGSRTPEEKATYPTDPYKINTFQPMGWGQLTNNGKRISYKLGEKLRERYANFLGTLYTPDIVMANSTDFDRTKMTALLVLAGLFPPASSQQWHDTLKWLPIPVQYEKDAIDYKLRRPNSYCPRYKKELDRVLASPEYQHIIKSNKNLFQYITKHTKKPMTKLLDLFDLYHTLNAEEMLNLTLPNWTKTVYPNDIHRLASKQCEAENNNTLLKRLNGGRMLSLVLNNMIQKANGTLKPAERKIYLYSGHETNVLSVLAAMNLYKPHIPKYNAALMIELHRMDENDGYGVKVLYMKDVNTKAEVQVLKGCDEVCPLDQFKDILAVHLPVDYTAECNSSIALD